MLVWYTAMNFIVVYVIVYLNEREDSQHNEVISLQENLKRMAVIEERNRVARDLHDSAKQKAFAALAQLGTVSGIFTRDPENAQFHLSEAENLVYEVIQELTFLLQKMYTMALKENE